MVHWAASDGFDQSTSLLLEFPGAAVAANVRNRDGKNARDLAQTRNSRVVKAIDKRLKLVKS